MQKEKQRNTREIISMEEYLSRRRKLKEQEPRGTVRIWGEEQNPAWMQAELYM